MIQRWRNPWPIEPVEVDGEFTALVEGREYEFEYEARLNPGGLDYFPDEVSIHRPPDMPWGVWERNMDEIREAALGDARRRYEMSGNPPTFSGRPEWRMEDIRHGQGHYIIVDDEEDAFLKAAEFADARRHVILTRPWKPKQGDAIAVVPDALKKTVFRPSLIGRVLGPTNLLGPYLIDIKNYYKSLGYDVGDALADVGMVMTSSQARSLSQRSTPLPPSFDVGGTVVMENPVVETSFGMYDFRITDSRLEEYKCWRPRSTKIACVYVHQKRPIEQGDVVGDIMWRREHERPFRPKDILEAVRRFLELPGNVSRRQADATTMKDKPALKIRAVKPIQYSRYAGCSMCPCSPGYIIYGDMDDRTTMWFAVMGRLDIWIEAIPGGSTESSPDFEPGGAR